MNRPAGGCARSVRRAEAVTTAALPPSNATLAAAAAAATRKAPIIRTLVPKEACPAPRNEIFEVMKTFATLALLFFASAARLRAQTLYAERNVKALLQTTPALVSAAPAGGSRQRQVRVLGTATSGFVKSDAVDDGFLSTAQEVLILPLDSGGSGGVFTTLLWTRIARAWKFVGYLPSKAGHLSVYLQRGRLNVVTPIYASGDPNCCPSKHHHEIDTLQATRLIRLAQFDSR
jgi:hypothetical protein